MIHITRPITQTQKTVPKTEDKSLDNHLSERKAPELVVYSKEQGQARDYSREDLERAVEDSNELIFRNEEQFKFEIHERTNRIMVKLVNTQTDEIIKEIPPEKILDLVANIWDLVGILVDERA
ncbi:flagellar protein FlaG [Alkalibaculum bacchi]|uniref:Flagellar protein FlaG n=1 Tax=Alkalibaculum bacchi TaxID=645887 RepID=A0A366II32_9FIRM|nr:flagellar protein FlaG [Alkalibaculum bacchi]RBP70115.1 flagellar protein FlaG [Alkalibaculum bacchi]